MSQFRKTWHLFVFFKAEMFCVAKMLEFSCVLMSTHSKLVLYSLKLPLPFFLWQKIRTFFHFKKYTQNSAKKVEFLNLLPLCFQLLDCLISLSHFLPYWIYLNFFNFIHPLFKGLFLSKILFISLPFPAEFCHSWIPRGHRRVSNLLEDFEGVLWFISEKTELFLGDNSERKTFGTWHTSLCRG